MRCNRGHENISAARHRLDQALRFVADSQPDLAHAACHRFIGHGGLAPDGPRELILRNQAASVLDEVAQGLEALRPQFYVATGTAQTATP